MHQQRALSWLPSQLQLMHWLQSRGTLPISEWATFILSYGAIGSGYGLTESSRCLGAVVLFCTSFKPLLDWVNSLTGTARGILAMFGCVAMFLQAAGYGMIYAVQPGATVLTTVLVADQFDPVLQQTAQAASFPLFYFFVTLGSFGGQALGPLIQSNQQVHATCISSKTQIVMGVAAGTMLLATFVLLFSRKHLIRKQPKVGSRR